MSESDPEAASPLFEAMQRAGASGPSMNLLVSRQASMAVKPREPLVGFFHGRAINKTQSKKKLGNANNLVYH
eukprot:8169125-Pyramimonas_sp.AAC.1